MSIGSVVIASAESALTINGLVSKSKLKTWHISSLRIFSDVIIVTGSLSGEHPWTTTESVLIIKLKNVGRNGKYDNKQEFTPQECEIVE